MNVKIERVISSLNEVLKTSSLNKGPGKKISDAQPEWSEISDSNLLLGKKILVSVIMTAYNNESMIERAVKSIVEQKTSFDFEVIIGVDHCSDNTLEMAMKCQEKWPGKVRVCYPTVNVGYQANRDYLHKAARATGGVDGKGYFAYCEADDAWDACDTKLAEQIALLESHPSWIGCVGPVRRIMNDGRIVLPDDEAISKKGVIKRGTIGSAYYHTTSYVFRRTTYEECHRMAPDLPEWMDILILIGANALGDIGYWRKIGSTHYITEKGMYTSLSDTERLLWELPYYIDWLKYCKSKDGQNLVLGILFRVYRRKGEMNKLWDADSRLMRELMCEIAYALPLFSRNGIFARFKLLFSKQY